MGLDGAQAVRSEEAHAAPRHVPDCALQRPALGAQLGEAGRIVPATEPAGVAITTRSTTSGTALSEG